MILHEGNNQLAVQMFPLVGDGHIIIHPLNAEPGYPSFDLGWSVRAFHPQYGECYAGDPPWAWQGANRPTTDDLDLDVSLLFGDPPVGCNRLLITVYSDPYMYVVSGAYNFLGDWSHDGGEWEFNFETKELTRL